MIPLTPHAPYEPAFTAALPHGIVGGVHLPPTPDPVPPNILSILPHHERVYARTLQGFRQPQFVGGRLALTLAFQELGVRRGPILSNPYGAPLSPPGFHVSVSHKKDIAIAIVTRGHRRVGIDIEELAPPRLSILPRILTPPELAAVEALPPDRRWTDALVRFSLKECVYKALNPYLLRYIGFEEAAVWPGTDGLDTVELALKEGEGPFVIEARHQWLNHHVLTTVRAEFLGEKK